MRVVHATAVHAGWAGFSRCLSEGRRPNLSQGSDTVAARKLTLHTNRIHICVCLQREKNTILNTSLRMYVNINIPASVYTALRQWMTSQFVRCRMTQCFTCTAAK